MESLIIVESRNMYINEILIKVEKSNCLNFDAIEIVKNLDNFVNVLDRNSFLNSTNYIFLYLSEENLSIIYEVLNKYRDTRYNIVPYLYIYTDIAINNLPEFIFDENVEFLFFDLSYKETASKLVKCVVSKNNSKKITNKNVDIDKKQYIEKIISIISDDYTSDGYKYILEACLIYIYEPTKISLPFNRIYDEIALNMNTDGDKVNRSIRKFIDKGLKSKNKLLEFSKATNLDISTFKATNANVIVSIVLGYQQYIINID